MPLLVLFSGERNVKYKELKKREETMDGMSVEIVNLSPPGELDMLKGRRCLSSRSGVYMYLVTWIRVPRTKRHLILADKASFRVPFEGMN